MTNVSRQTHPAIIALLTLPYGIASGWAFTTLPISLEQHGFYPAILLLFTAMTLYFFRILPAPLLDLTLSLRRWYLIGLVICISGILPFFWLLLDPETKAKNTITLLACISQVGALLMLLAATGFMVRCISPEKMGRAAGCYQVGITGGYGLALLGALAIKSNISWHAVFVSQIVLMLTGIIALYLLPAVRAEKTQPFKAAVTKTLSDARSWFGSRKGIFITLMALSPIGLGSATVGWSNGMQQYAIPDNEIRLIIGPLSIGCSLVGYLVGGWASDRHGRWNTWLGVGSLLALMALLIAFCPYIPWLFDAGILVYTILSGCCLAAFWAILIQAVSPRLAVTKITLLSMLIGVAVNYTKDLNGWICDNFSFQFMLIAEALLSFICIGVALLLKRRLRRSGPEEFSPDVPTN